MSNWVCHDWSEKLSGRNKIMARVQKLIRTRQGEMESPNLRVFFSKVGRNDWYLYAKKLTDQEKEAPSLGAALIKHFEQNDFLWMASSEREDRRVWSVVLVENGQILVESLDAQDAERRKLRVYLSEANDQREVHMTATDYALLGEWWADSIPVALQIDSFMEQEEPLLNTLEPDLSYQSLAKAAQTAKLSFPPLLLLVYALAAVVAVTSINFGYTAFMEWREKSLAREAEEARLEALKMRVATAVLHPQISHVVQQAVDHALAIYDVSGWEPREIAMQEKKFSIKIAASNARASADQIKTWAESNKYTLVNLTPESAEVTTDIALLSSEDYKALVSLDNTQFLEKLKKAGCTAPEQVDILDIKELKCNLNAAQAAKLYRIAEVFKKDAVTTGDMMLKFDEGLNMRIASLSMNMSLLIR